jgi:hypothetical protein
MRYGTRRLVEEHKETLPYSYFSVNITIIIHEGIVPLSLLKPVLGYLYAYV